jgi:hypothetical protein
MAASGNAEPSNGPRTAPGIAESFARVWEWSKQGKAPESTGRDGFPTFADDPLAGLHRRLNDYLQQIRITMESWKINPKKFPAGAALLALSPEDMAAVLRAIVVRMLFHDHQEEERRGGRDRQEWMLEEFHLLNRMATAFGTGAGTPAERLVDPVEFGTLTSEMFRTDLPFTEADLASFLGIAAEQAAAAYFQAISNEAVLRALERHAARCELSQALRQQLEGWSQKLQSTGRLSSPARKLLTRIHDLLGQGDNSGIEAGEAWSNAAMDDLKKMSSPERARWLALLQHCQKAESSKPTQKWSKAARSLVEEIGAEAFKAAVIRWFELVRLPRPLHREPEGPSWPDPDQLIADRNSVILKGLAWSCADRQDANLSRALSDLAQVCFKKVRNLGPRCPRLGNACLYSLSSSASEDAAAQLSRLDQTVKQPTAKKLIGKSLNKAAELTGQTREDLEESTVPDFGLDTNGCLRQKFGDFTAEFKVSGPDQAELLWRKADGKLQKSVPAEIKERHADDFKKFKRTLKDIETMLPAQRTRIERLFMTEREWTLDKWRARYLDHPLLSFLARRLIWHFRLGERTALGIWHLGKLVDVQGRALDWLAPETVVRLWHPIGFGVETIEAWRRWLESNQICQPFKQAHREIYILTDAELQTETYSNRFAAHIVKQHQFAALAQQRGWKYALMGSFDFHCTPTLPLPQWGLSVEFWVDPTAAQANDVSGNGIALYLATDQVRFLRDGAALPLTEVPATVLTEVMRDVDLFVGVCSIGNDPGWQDRGELEGGGTYWHNYSFGDLSASAKTRRDVLERLLPKLKISKQCVLKDKYLVVRGELRTYKIHLGSGNILMEPNDQYLCIVPDRGTASSKSGEVFLPFEGDHTLAIILSKAFLLAADSNIKDPSILNQIKRT